MSAKVKDRKVRFKNFEDFSQSDIWQSQIYRLPLQINKKIKANTKLLTS